MRTTLDDVCKSIADGDQPAPPKSADGIPFITISCLDSDGGQPDYAAAARVPLSYYDSLPDNRRAQPGDVLLSVVGSLGIPYLVKREDKFVFQRHIAILRPGKDLLPEYLYYLLKSPDSFHYIDSVAQGAAQRTFTLTQLRGMEVDIPSLDEQRRTVAALEPYDQLIENNRKQISLLEEATQRLYKEWFVDLRFPGHEDAEIVDGVPNGWRVATIREVCKKIQSGGTPSRKKQNYWNPPIVKWFKTGELRDCWLIEPEERISEEGLNGSAAKLFEPGTIVMAIYASPTLGRLGILDCEAAFNQAMLGFIVDENVVTCEWLYWKLYELRTEFNMIARGAGQQNISAEIVKSYEIVLPTYEVIDAFTNAVGAMSKRRLVLQRQIIELTEARDRLLPKLMSGEIEGEG